MLPSFFKKWIGIMFQFEELEKAAVEFLSTKEADI